MRSWFFISFFSWMSLTSRLTASETSHLDSMRLAAERSNARSAKLYEAVKTIDVDSVSAAEEKAVILFSRGLALLEKDTRQASLSFELAQKALPPKSPLYGLASIYFGRASLNKSNSRVILSKLKTISNGGLNKSPMWRPEKYALMLEIVMIMEQDRLLVRTWNDMNARVKRSLRDERLVPQVISYLERRQIHTRTDLWPLVEALASEYPHSDGGRWAFQKLQELSCLHPKPYIYSVSLISRLSSNVNLDEGLKYFLIDLTRGPVRFASGRVGQMDELDRINFLYQNRFWNESRRLLEERIAELQSRQDTTSRIEYSKALSVLGQIQSRQGDYENAVRTWSLYVELFQGVTDVRPAMETLADSLSKLRYHKQAAEIYQQLAKSSGVDPLVRWHHFWNLYLAGDYSQALDLLNRGNYVPHRDRGFEGGLDYWKARILERLNKLSEAEKIYQKILSESGSGFYSALVQARRPDLMDGMRRNVNPSVPLANIDAETDEAAIRLSSDKLSRENGLESVAFSLDGVSGQQSGTNNTSMGIDKSQQSQYATVAALGRWGQKQIARRLLRILPAMNRKNVEAPWADTFRLAMDLKDYSYGFKAPQMQGSPLRRTPNGAADLEVHMLQYNSDWRLLYPYAFREIVEPVSRSVAIDPFLVLSLMRAESVYDEFALSPVGALGLMQIMPFTAIRLARVMQHNDFELAQLRDPEINISYAAYYIKKLNDYYKGNTMLAVAAYNGGPRSVDRWLAHFSNLEMDELVETISFRETRRYVKSVYRNMGHYKFIWQQARALAALPKVPNETAGGEIF